MRKDSNSNKPGSDRFKKDSGGRSGRDGDKKPSFRKDSSDRPKRRDDDSDRPKRSFNKDDGDRPKRSFDNDRPKRSFDGDKPKRSFGKRDEGGDDRPKRSFDNDRPKRSFDGDKPKRSFGKRDEGGDDRPKRSFDNDRPKRSFDSDKPKRTFGKRDEGDNDRPKRSFDNDRPKRSFDSDKPKRSFGKRDEGDNDRPKRSFDNDRPKRSFDGDKPKRTFGKRDEGGDDRPRRDYDNDRPKRSFDGDKPKRSFGKRDEVGDERPKRDYKSDKSSNFSDKDKGKPKKKRTFADTMDDAFNNKLPETAEQKEEKRKKKEAEPKQEEEKEVKGLAKKPKQNSFDRSVGKIRTTRGTDMDAYVEKKASKADDTEKPKKVKKIAEDGEEELDIDNGEAGELMPLNKYISHSGECSRREAAELVKQGKVKVNGTLITDPGHKVTKEDQVTVAGKKMVLQSDHVYILLNKPKGFITTTDDPEGRRTVMDLVEEAEADRIFPVGRLDRNTTGLLLMTNDGALAQKLSHPSNSIKKVYQVTLDKNLTKADFEKIANGLELEDGPVNVDEIAMLEEKNEVGVEIHSGRNRIVRRIFEHLGYQVEKLDRVMYAGLTKKNLPRSNWRYLTEKEIILLKHFKS